MKTDYKPGDKVVVVKYAAPLTDNARQVGNILTVKGLSPNPDNIRNWQVYFEEALGLDFVHIRPLTPLEKELE